MRLFAIAATFVAMCSPVFAAQVRTFPYTAIVETDGLEVRSGQGRRFYVTNKLKRGTRVIVHRHDPGGWYMIAPPANSFSWIRAEHVRPTQAGLGVVTAIDVAIHVGSATGSQFDVLQRFLSTGDEVVILGKANLRFEGESIAMVKIKPPQGEWRWVSGESVTPANAKVRSQLDTDPFETPSVARGTIQVSAEEFDTDNTIRTADGSDEFEVPLQPDDSAFEDFESTESDNALPNRKLAERPLVRLNANDRIDSERSPRHKTTQPRTKTRVGASVARSEAPSEEMQEFREQLKLVDRHFQEMIKLETSQWNISQIEDEYRQLQQTAPHPALASQVNLRMGAVERYAVIQQRYDEFVALTSETEKREAELSALQEKQMAEIVTVSPEEMIIGDGVEVTIGAGGPNGPSFVPNSEIKAAQPTLSGPTLAGPEEFNPSETVDPQFPTADGGSTIETQPSVTLAPQNSVPPPTRQAPITQNVPPPTQTGPFPQPQSQRQTQSQVQPQPRPQANVRQPQSPQQITRNFPPQQRMQLRQQPRQPQSQQPQIRQPQVRQQPVAQPRFDGAGIIQNAVTVPKNGPRHVLMAPNGRILAYLQTKNDKWLDQFVGQSMGIVGNRTRRTDLQTDVIEVRQVAPVQLQP